MTRSVAQLIEMFSTIERLLDNQDQQREKLAELQKALLWEQHKEVFVPNEQGMVSFTPDSTIRLMKAYHQAIENGEEQFVFDGNDYLVAYARYLLEFLVGRFEPHDDQFVRRIGQVKWRHEQRMKVKAKAAM